MYINKKQEVPGRNNSLFSYDTTRATKKTMPPAVLHSRGNVLTDPLLLCNPHSFISCDTDHTGNDACNSSSLLCVFMSL